MELSIEPKLIEESALPAFSYLYSEYTSFADELTKKLIEQFPWFAEILKSFAKVEPVFFYEYAGETTVYNTIDKGTLSLHIHTTLAKVKDKVRTSLLDPIIEVVEGNIPALFLWESLGYSLVIILEFYDILNDIKYNLDKLRKLFTEKEKKRSKALKKLSEGVKRVNEGLKIIKNYLEEGEVPKRPLPTIENIGYVRYVRKIYGGYKEYNVTPGLLLYTFDVPGIYYPFKYVLLNMYLVYKRLPEIIDTLVKHLKEGSEPSDNEFRNITAFFGVLACIQVLSDRMTSLKLKYKSIDRPEQFNGAYKVYENMMKHYTKVRKKDEVKFSDLKDVLHKVVVFIG